MIPLTSTTDSLSIKLGAAVTLNQLQCMAVYREETSSQLVPKRNVVVTNDTTEVTLIGSPASGKTHLCDYLSIYNSDTSPSQIIVIFNDNTTEYILFKVSLSSGDKAEYTAKEGWRVISNAGSVKTALNQGASPVSSGDNMVILGSDVINNEAVANTLKDVTGLSFDVVAGGRYYFEFIGFYTSAATTTGSRWTINGPTVTALAYESQYTASTTAITQNQAQTSYNLPSASNATSAANGNIFRVAGWITPATDGTVQLRFASEISSSAITAKAGSYLKYIQLF